MPTHYIYIHIYPCPCPSPHERYAAYMHAHTWCATARSVKTFRRALKAPGRDEKFSRSPILGTSKMRPQFEGRTEIGPSNIDPTKKSAADSHKRMQSECKDAKMAVKNKAAFHLPLVEISVHDFTSETKLTCQLYTHFAHSQSDN